MRDPKSRTQQQERTKMKIIIEIDTKNNRYWKSKSNPNPHPCVELALRNECISLLDDLGIRFTVALVDKCRMNVSKSAEWRNTHVETLTDEYLRLKRKSIKDKIRKQAKELKGVVTINE